MHTSKPIYLTDAVAARAIRCLYYRPSSASTEVSACIGKSLPHTIKLLNDLIAAGYVIETGYGSSSGGRRPQQYSLAAGLFYTLSVALTRFGISIALLNTAHQVAGPQVQQQINLSQYSAAALVDAINLHLNSAGVPRDKIIGAGITMPGFVDTKRGVNYTFLQVEGGPSLVEYIQQGIGVPVFIDNDSTAVAMGEQKFGVATGRDDVMVINLAWGIGLGMIVNGEIFRGHTGLAGEFSHIPLVKNGKLCNCGKHGCLETEASLMAITDKAYAELGQGQNSSLAGYEVIDADAIISEAIKGDRLAVRLISEAAYDVGQCLAILIHIMNPATIVLSGKASVVGRLWLSPIQQAINEHCIPRLAAETQIILSELKDTAQLTGGAVLVIENLGKPLMQKLESLEKTATVK